MVAHAMGREEMTRRDDERRREVEAAKADGREYVTMFDWTNMYTTDELRIMYDGWAGSAARPKMIEDIGRELRKRGVAVKG